MRLPLCLVKWKGILHFSTRTKSLSSVRLWVMTVNALQPSVKLLRQQKYTQNDLMVDPLIVLRCDSRVFRYYLLRNA